MQNKKLRYNKLFERLTWLPSLPECIVMPTSTEEYKHLFKHTFMPCNKCYILPSDTESMVYMQETLDTSIREIFGGSAALFPSYYFPESNACMKYEVQQ